ncbi:MAG TPA: ABC transporter substrate-binding protein [Egibacteraceae bacterium]|nr:ABC transporter substrate-binding protein [Egibacteraceae bacterium]
MRRARRTTLLLVALALAAACDPGAAPPPAAPSPAGATSAPPSATLRVAIDRPDALLPQRADEQAEQWLADAVFDSLTRWGPDLRPVPAAAVSWSADASQRVWTFRLREDAAWHDGRPVLAADFVRGWRALVRAGRMAHLLFDVEGVDGTDPARAEPAVRALDARTLEVRLRRPSADFPAVAAHPALAPLPPGADSAEYAARPVGNGPFAVPEAGASSRFVRVGRFPGWRNGPAPALDEIVFQVMDPETAFLAFQQQRVHLSPVPPGALTALLTESPGSAWRGERAVLYLLGMDHTRPPFDRVEARRALSLAVDRVALAAAVSEGAAAPAGGLLPAWLPEAVPERCGSCVRDPGAARELFAQAGVTALRLSFNTGAGHETVARRVRDDLAEAGVALEFDARPGPEFLAAARAGELTLFRLGWQPDVPVAGAVLRPLLHGDAVPSGPEGVRHNLGRYRAADVDALLDQARQTAAPLVRAATYRRAARLALERDQAVVPLFVSRHRLARAPEAAGLAPDPMGQVDWAAVRLER